MEKKTIGKLISALRKANGMTQKDLGEKLFVSDKTVSRWECDECTPELSLIPAIAEIFGITTDELLRGERNNPDRAPLVSEDLVNKQKAKRDKQFKLMLDRNDRKYKNLTLISVGITIFGFLAASIANLGFSKGLIAFCLATAFCVASEICQIGFAINARIAVDEDDDTYTEKIQSANTGVIKTAVLVTFINLLLFAFCLPLITMIDGANYGLTFEYWLGHGLIVSAIAFVIGGILYTFWIREVLTDKGLITLSEKQSEINKKGRTLLIKTICISTAIALVLGVTLSIIGQNISVKEHVFYTCEDFKTFMESEYEAWCKEGYSYSYSYIDMNGNPFYRISEQITTSPDAEKDYEYHEKVYVELRNSKGEVVCEYYHNPNLYTEIRFTESAEDMMPATVITTQDWLDAFDMSREVQTLAFALIAIDYVTAACVYCIKLYRLKKSLRTS